MEDIATCESQTPALAVEQLSAVANLDGGPHFETEEWFLHPGMSEDDIHAARELTERDNADA